jgi:uridine kinase
LYKNLRSLAQGKKVITKSFPKKAGAKSHRIVLQPKKYIVVEGFMLFKDKKVRDFLDIKIYLDIPARLMLKRRVIRFGANHVNEYDTKVAIPEFLKNGVTQKKYADFVVNASQSQEKVFSRVQKIIKGKLV